MLPHPYGPLFGTAVFCRPDLRATSLPPSPSGPSPILYSTGYTSHYKVNTPLLIRQGNYQTDWNQAAERLGNHVLSQVHVVLTTWFVLGL